MKASGRRGFFYPCPFRNGGPFLEGHKSTQGEKEVFNMNDHHHHSAPGSETATCGHHHHNGDVTVELSPKERLTIRLEHLLAHNREHQATYGQLAEEATAMGEHGASGHIRSVRDLTDAQNHALEQALASLKS
jgi:hypothetical protein